MFDKSGFPLLALVLSGLLLLASCDDGPVKGGPVVPFAAIEDTTLKDPDNPTVKFRVDMAKVEHDFPLSRPDRMKLNPENLAAMTQEQVDQVYGRLTAGPVPDGVYRGSLFFARGDSVRPLSDDFRVRLEEVFGGIGGRLKGKKIELLEKVGRGLWKGKVFYRDKRILRNMIEDLKPFERIIDDPDGIMTIKIPRSGWLGYILPSNRVSLLFPAKLFCGQSLMDSRRESIIIDYLFSDEIEGYRKSPDSLAGRGGLKVRDEIRMVRPGLYLGRAYANKLFLLNFVLHNQELAEQGAEAFLAQDPIAEDCWSGEQQRSATLQ